MTDKYKLVGHEPVPVHSLREWARWFETADRNVMRTELIDGSVVSTVFLGIDHGWSSSGPPVLFETALFADDGDVNVCGRYCTWAEAEAGHREWLERCVPPDMVALTKKHDQTTGES